MRLVETNAVQRYLAACIGHFCKITVAVLRIGFVVVLRSRVEGVVKDFWNPILASLESGGVLYFGRDANLLKRKVTSSRIAKFLVGCKLENSTSPAKSIR